MVRWHIWGLVIAALALGVSGCAPEPHSYWVPYSEFKARHGLHTAQGGITATPHRRRSKMLTHVRSQSRKAAAKQRRPAGAAPHNVALAPTAPQVPNAGAKASAGQATPAGEATAAATDKSGSALSAARGAAGPGSDMTSKGIIRARAKFESGQVREAREIIQSEFAVGPVEVLVYELARTYDPWYLRQLPVSDVTADISLARRYYEDAKLMGSAQAAVELQRLERLETSGGTDTFKPGKPGLEPRSVPGSTPGSGGAKTGPAGN